MKSLLIILYSFLFIPPILLAQDINKNISEVTVIAHSISTSSLANQIRVKMKWTEVSPKKADYVLVVCRSGLSFPLNSSYECYCELDEAAENQLNISGSNYHIYLFYMNDDLSVKEIYHDYYEADDY